jgi:hypothetical protein
LRCNPREAETICLPSTELLENEARHRSCKGAQLKQAKKNIVRLIDRVEGSFIGGVSLERRRRPNLAFANVIELIDWK